MTTQPDKGAPAAPASLRVVRSVFCPAPDAPSRLLAYCAILRRAAERRQLEVGAQYPHEKL